MPAFTQYLPEKYFPPSFGINAPAPHRLLRLYIAGRHPYSSGDSGRDLKEIPFLSQEHQNVNGLAISHITLEINEFS